jgi:hypothetical protein
MPSERNAAVMAAAVEKKCRRCIKEANRLCS